MKTETLLQPGTIEVRDDDGKRTITGYASVFYDGTPATQFELMPGVVERVMAGAFRKVLRSKKTDAAAVFDHDNAVVLGRMSNGTLRLEEDAIGLRFSIDPPDTQAARDLMTLIARGDVKGSSIQFGIGPKGDRIRRVDGATIREIVEVARLVDVGPVVHPAFEGTTAQVRNLDEKRLADEIRAIRDREVAMRLRLIHVQEQELRR